MGKCDHLTLIFVTLFTKKCGIEHALQLGTTTLRQFSATHWVDRYLMKFHIVALEMKQYLVFELHFINYTLYAVTIVSPHGGAFRQYCTKTTLKLLHFSINERWLGRVGEAIYLKLYDTVKVFGFLVFYSLLNHQQLFCNSIRNKSP